MTNEVEYWTERLIKEVVLLGHPAEFGRLLAANLGSEKSIRRLALYVAHNQPASAEDIADEMLAICDERDAWRRKKEAEYYSQKVNAWYNRDRKKDQDCEMYPLYWTPSKEGTFCVIRLNLS
ncbi:hypothetical protein [Acidaminococcus intestini]|nr:hypothetical protein [Acidaminococcus intestini]